jgi:hypothetical protein
MPTLKVFLESLPPTSTVASSQNIDLCAVASLVFLSNRRRAKQES